MKKATAIYQKTLALKSTQGFWENQIMNRMTMQYNKKP